MTGRQCGSPSRCRSSIRSCAPSGSRESKSTIDLEAQVKVDRRFKLVMLLLATAVQGAAAAQPVRRAYTLSVTKEATPFVNLIAQDAKLSDVAADLAVQLGAKVIVAPSLKNERLTVRVEGTPLEAAMLAIAPHVLID